MFLLFLVFFVRSSLIVRSDAPEDADSCQCWCNAGWCCANGCDAETQIDFSSSAPPQSELMSPVDNPDPGMSCFCWINRNRHSQQYTGGYTIEYIPPGQFEVWTCRWCGNPSSPLHVDLKGDFCWPISGRCGPDDSDSEKKSRVGKMDIGLIGDFATCLDLCKQYQQETQLFIGAWQADYTPRSEFSEGYCLCEGFIDPCRYPG